MTRDYLMGLEVHVYVRTEAKLFCSCSADFLAARAPNEHVCATCTGQPGAKPSAPNAAALSAGYAVGHALGCTLTPDVRFVRKHYFYPDLPSNYQRTSEPFARAGSLAGVTIDDIHWEEDPGQYDLTAGVVDYDRSGSPLLEIVTAPDVESPDHARRFLNELRLVLDYLGVARSEAGIKADCNVSVGGGPRAEVKNVNSVRNVEAALAFELNRQREAVANGESLAQETRHFDETMNRTVRLRVKETAADYRFLPDPDLPVFCVPQSVLDGASAQEQPVARRARLAAAADVPSDDVSPLFEERALVDAFEAVIAAGVAAPTALSYFVRDVRSELEYRKQAFRASRIDADDVAALLTAVVAKRLQPQAGTRVLRHGLDKGGLKVELERELAASAAAEGVDLAALAAEVLGEQPKAVADYRAGKTQVVNFIVGQLMRKTKGRASADAAREAVLAALDG